MTDVHALPIPGHVAGVSVSPYIQPDGTPGLFWTAPRGRAGSSGYHGIELYGFGPGGAARPFAILAARDARRLGELLARAAQALDAAEEAVRGHVVAVPCRCAHYDHREAVAGLCQASTTDYRFGRCAECRDPDTGTQWTHTDGRARLAAREEAPANV